MFNQASTATRVVSRIEMRRHGGNTRCGRGFGHAGNDSFTPCSRATRQIWSHYNTSEPDTADLASQPTAPCVLIVESNDEVALFMHEALEDSGYNVACVANLAQAQRAMQDAPFALVIVDWNLIRAGDGLLDGNRKQSRPPAIRATGGFQGNVADLQRLCPGVLAVLPRPFGLKTLLLAVASVLAVAQKTRH